MLSYLWTLIIMEEDIQNHSLLNLLAWPRYNDDVFMLWQHGEEELKKYLDTINCYHPTIKFTAEYTRPKINILDVTVMKKGYQLVTDLYLKSTDTHLYLNASLCHISQCKKSLPFSQAVQ